MPITLTYLREAPTSTGFITVPLAARALPLRVRAHARRSAGAAAVAARAAAVRAARRFGSTARRRPGGRVRALARVVDASATARRAVGAALCARARLGARCSCASAACCVALVPRRWRRRSRWRSSAAASIERVRFDFLENLGTRAANIEYRAAAAVPAPGDRFVCRDEDGNLDNERYVASSPAEIEEYTMVRCIRARPEQNALLRDRLTRACRVGRRHRRLLRHRARRAPDEHDAPGRLRVMRRRQASRTRAQPTRTTRCTGSRRPIRRSRRRDVSVTFAVRADNVSKRYFCFYAQMADLGQGPPPVPGVIQRKYAEDEDEDQNEEKRHRRDAKSAKREEGTLDLLLSRFCVLGVLAV